jgi:hypothetical protein
VSGYEHLRGTYHLHLHVEIRVNTEVIHSSETSVIYGNHINIFTATITSNLRRKSLAIFQN